MFAILTLPCQVGRSLTTPLPGKEMVLPPSLPLELMVSQT